MKTVAKITLNISEKTFAPLAKVQGKCEWELDPLGSDVISINLMIFTRRRHTKQFNNAMKVEGIRITGADELGSVAFSFTLPEFPYSFEGNLFILYYAIEATIENGPQSQVVIECNYVSP